MKAWKVFALAGYVAGIAVALRHAKKTSTEVNAELAAGKNGWDVLWENFVSIHTSLFEKAKEAYWTEETQQYVQNVKEKITLSAEDFKKEALLRFEELKSKEKEWIKKGQEELEKLYEQRMDLLQKAKNLSHDAMIRVKTELQDAYRWLESRIRS